MPNDWLLSYPGEALTFGTIASRFVFTEAPDLGPTEIHSEDAARPRADGVIFGADFHGGRTITFELAVDGKDETDGRTLLGRLGKAWRADKIRQSPGAVAMLTSGGGRVTFGRPRRFASNDEYLPQGLAHVVADFACAEDVWYGGEQSVNVALQPPPGGGLIAPLASPLATTATSDRSTVIRIGGEVSTWPVFEIQGPIVNPIVEIVGLLKMEFRTSLAFDQKLVVDTRPWVRSILRNGASVAGSLTRTSTRLSKAAIPPGSYELVLRGTSDSGTASVTTRWRDAYTTP